MNRLEQDALCTEANSAYGAAVRRPARGYEAEPERRRDLLQEIHIELWRSLESFDGRCRLQTWVYRISHNVDASHIVRSCRLSARLVDLDTIEPIQSRIDGETQASRTSPPRSCSK